MDQGNGEEVGRQEIRSFTVPLPHSSVPSAQCWMNPSTDMEAGLRVGLLTQNTGKETLYQMSSADYRQEEMQL